ncbi:MCE family protein [Chitinophaga pendula]|uniref:MlaD family protein n=1 Tax=Chitinophaga TaxID=79328 RepID=UPI000BAEF91C|nr:MULTISPECIES: MlaD family protein [Chitinophaga]ASZ12684.1 ABC transporter permease [Chitinophaga sp. MD30]UCJ09704.1 MCE family protein [Chitinophaga pendula]
MKESSTRRSVIVGIFILLALVIFGAAILVLGGQRKSFISAVTVKAVFHDVGGLSKGNNIWYSGVKVGTIRKITFVRTSEIEVMMDIDKSSREFIHKDVRAKVSSDGLVGNKIIALSGGSDKMPPIEDGDMIAVETSISTDEIMNTLQVNNKSLVEITGNLKVITKKIMDGQGTLGKLVNDEAVYDNLAGTLATLEKTAANTQRLTQGLADYTSKFQRKGTLANDLVTDTAVFANLRTTVAQLQQVAQHANGVVQNLNSATSSINDKLQTSNSPAGVLLNDQQAASDLKQTLSNLNVSTGKLDENMEALQHNFLLRGYFRKKAKREKKEQEAREKAIQRGDTTQIR